MIRFPMVAVIAFTCALAQNSVALSAVNLDTPYTCILTETTNKQVPTGSLAWTGIKSNKLILRDLTNGFISLGEGRTIDFYGSLSVYDVYAVGSDILAFSTDFDAQREVEGSIFVTEISSRKIELNISIFDPTIRVFKRSTGQQAFIIKDAPLFYKLSCED